MKPINVLSCPSDNLTDFCVPRCWGGIYPCWPNPFPPKPWTLPKPWEDPRLMADWMDIVTIMT